jgi:hypothetical protein
MLGVWYKPVNFGLTAGTPGIHAALCTKEHRAAALAIFSSSFFNHLA